MRLTARARRRCLEACLVAICGMTIVTAAGGSTPLIDAVKSGNREAIRALLKNGTDANVPEADGTTALHWAVQANDVASVQALLRAGARPTSPIATASHPFRSLRSMAPASSLKR